MCDPPLFVRRVKYDSVGRPSRQYVGRWVTIAVNPDTKYIVRIWPTSSKIRRRNRKQMTKHQILRVEVRRHEGNVASIKFVAPGLENEPPGQDLEVLDDDDVAVAIMEFSAHGRLTGIELLGADRQLPPTA